MRKQYRGYAVGTTLAIEASAGATSFTVAGSGGASFPSTGVPFVITIDRGLSTEEKVLCGLRTGDVFTVAADGRGYDGTTAVLHGVGAKVEHTIDAVLECQKAGTSAYLGGSCAETDSSARAAVHVAIATRPAMLLAKPGMGVDEALTIVGNEMNRTVAELQARAAG